MERIFDDFIRGLDLFHIWVVITQKDFNEHKYKMKFSYDLLIGGDAQTHEGMASLKLKAIGNNKVNFLLSVFDKGKNYDFGSFIETKDWVLNAEKMDIFNRLAIDLKDKNLFEEHKK